MTSAEKKSGKCKVISVLSSMIEAHKSFNVRVEKTAVIIYFVLFLSSFKKGIQDN